MTDRSIILDCQGLELTTEDRERLAHPACAGLILFTRNYDSRSQIRELTRAIKSIHSELLILIDQEGGRVQRFQKDFPVMKALGEWGAQYSKSPDQVKSEMREAIVCLEQNLIECGVDINLTPVLDLNLEKNEVIGLRSFSRDPDVVSLLGAHYLNVLHEIGRVGVGKHYPGHGGVCSDSHITLPVDERSFEAIKQQDLKPFSSLVNQLDAVMPGHVVYPAVDDNPAGFSVRWIREVLREELGFQGAVISDDLSMQGAVDFYPSASDRVEAAREAGCDLLLVCNNHSSVAVALETAERFSSPAQAARRRALLNKLRRADHGNA